MPDTRTYIRVHDGLDEHPKVEGLSDAAFRLLVSAWCYCSRNLTDGRLTDAAWRKRGTPKARRELLAVGLAVQRHGFVEMHDYLEHQRSADEVADLRSKRAEAGRRGGKAKANALASASPVAKQELEQTPSKPVAEGKQESKQTGSKPVAETETEKEPPLPPADAGGPKPKRSRRSPATPLPPDFAITEDMRAWHRSKGISDRDADRQTENFTGHAIAKDVRWADWTQAWRNWLNKAVEFGHIQPATGERRWTAEDVDRILGPDTWRLPPAPTGLRGDDYSDWAAQQRTAHRRERITRAQARMNGHPA
jgi:hypothetical protein